jgi:GTP-binding protein
MRRAPPSMAKKRHQQHRRPPKETSIPQEGLPVVAIVGRPNVGKSTLFNVWAKRRRSVVNAAPGTTRDRIAAVVTAERADGRQTQLVLVDTGGIGVIDDGRIAREVTAQIERAIVEADVLVLLLDVRSGLLPLDYRVADMLRRANKPVVVAATKCETDALELDAANFQQLGLGDVLPISAEARKNLDTLRERITDLVPEAHPVMADEGAYRICIVGRRNAGKSTFVNVLAGSERVVVSAVPGTTRDPVDVRVEIDGHPVVLVDTAGVGRRHEGTSGADHFSLAASRRSIERAETIVMLVDAQMRVGTVEREIAKLVNEHYRSCVIVVNKWDIAEQNGASSDEFASYIGARLPALSQAPIVFVSALKAERVVDAASIAVELSAQARTQRPTSQLNKLLRRAIDERRPSSARGAIPKVYYATQVGISPPSIIVFVNDVSRFAPSYVQFLENRFREYWDERTGSGEVPVRVILKARPRVDRRTSSHQEPPEIA